MHNTGLKILVGLPLYKGLEPKATAPLINALLHTQRAYSGATIQLQITNHVYHGKARQTLVDKFLAEGWTYLFLFDEDMILSVSGLTKLLDHKVKLASVISFCRDKPYLPHFGNFTKDGRFLFYAGELPKDCLYADVATLGCCLMHKSAFDGLQHKIFGPRETFLTQDFGFFLKMVRHGNRTLIDPTIEVGHINEENPVITKNDYNRVFKLGEYKK